MLDLIISRYRHDHGRSSVAVKHGRRRRHAGHGRHDIANARITFKSGCITNVTASHVSYRPNGACGSLPITSTSTAIRRREVFGYRLRGDPMTEGIAAMAPRRMRFKRDMLPTRSTRFFDCITTGKKPLVDGRAGSEALRVASMINESIEGICARCARAPALRGLAVGEPPA